MGYINNIKKSTNDRAEVILSDGLNTLNAIESLLKKCFSVKKLSEIEEKYETMISKDPLAANKSLNEGILSFNDLISECIEDIQTLERYISLHVPQMEDGNNFGVTVQLTISKFLDETREDLCKLLEKIPPYYCSRAEAVEKLDLPQTTKLETMTVTNSHTTGGKDGDENKSSETNVKEEKILSSDKGANFNYRRKHLLSLDVQLYRTLRCGLIDCYDSYLTILDNIEKNREKLLQPKGQNGGANLGMY